MTEWLYKFHGKDCGPLSGTEIRELVADGVITRETLVSRDGGETWTPAIRFKGLFVSEADHRTAQSSGGRAFFEAKSNAPVATDSSIPISCAACGNQMSVPETYTGMRIRCKKCREAMLVPSSGSEWDSQIDDATALDDQATDDWARRETLFSPMTNASSRPPKLSPVRQKASAQKRNRTRQERCPFPGSIIERLLGRESQNAEPESVSVAIGWAYAITNILVIVSVFVIMIKTGPTLVSVLGVVSGGFLLSLFWTLLHFANHKCIQTFDTLLRKPSYSVQSINHLQLVAIPFLLLGILLLLMALPMLVSTLYGLMSVLADTQFDPMLMSRIMDLAWPTLILIAGLTTCRLFWAVLANPDRVGVYVDDDATSAETFLGILAALFRAPLITSKIAHISAVVSAVLFSLTMLCGSFGLVNTLVSVIGGTAFCWTLVAIQLPLVAYIAYIAYIVGMFGVELLNAILDIRRQVVSIAKRTTNVEEDSPDSPLFLSEGIESIV